MQISQASSYGKVMVRKQKIYKQTHVAVMEIFCLGKSKYLLKSYAKDDDWKAIIGLGSFL